MEERNRGTYSPALLEAQKKLEVLRCQHQSAMNTAGAALGDRGRSLYSYLGAADRPHPFLACPGPAISSSSRFFDRSLPADTVEPVGTDHSNTCFPLQPEPSCPSGKNKPGSPPTKRWVKLYPDIALGMLRQEVVSAGRIWLLLQFIDEKGSGWVTLKSARNLLSDTDAELRICGRRQLRKLLSRGEGLFWRRDHERIWLKSAAKVAAALNVQRLTGSPVALPVGELLKGVGHTRAHFYASFHSGRNKEARGGKGANPIARSTLQRLSHTSRRSQQRYERRAGIEAQSNIALGGVSTVENDQRTAWKHGTAAFRFKDSAGKIGRRGVSYSAWQLPNNYTGPHATRPKGNQKRINRALADLFMKGMTGNGKNSDGFCSGSGRGARAREHVARQLYHKHGLSAATSYARSPSADAYWPDSQSTLGSYQRWFIISGKDNA